MSFDFDTPVDRYGTWSVQWDGVADRFGVDGLLPFTISDMDFPSAPVLLDALHQRISHGVFGYTDWRLGDFRPAVAHWFATRHDTPVDTDRLVYAPSVLNQLSQLLRMWTEPGDEVVLHTPTYDGFRKAVDGLGRVRVPAPLDDPEFRVLEGLLARERARVLLLCSPHNPTGKVWSAEELTALAALARRHGVAVISDEIHADFVHPGRRHLPWTRFGGEGERWALITSGSKAFNFPALTGSYGFLGNAEDHAAFVRRMETGEGLASPAVLSLTAHIAAYRHGAPGSTRPAPTSPATSASSPNASARPSPNWGGPRRRPATWPGSTCGRSASTRTRSSASWWSARRSPSCAAPSTTPRASSASTWAVPGPRRRRASTR